MRVWLLAVGLLVPLAVVAQPGPGTDPDFLRLPAPNRLVAIADTHGSMWALRSALELAGAVDSSGNWSGGDLVVVITGDFLDRGDDEIAMMDLLQRLSKQSRNAGGALRVLTGNHEAANVGGKFMEVTEKGYTEFRSEVPASELKSPFAKKFKKKERARAVAFRPGGPRASWLAGNPVVLMVGDTLFVHGGVLPEHVQYGLGRINREMREWMLGKAPKRPVYLLGSNGPLWTRRYSRDVDHEACKDLNQVLQATGAARMVVGHTVQPTINSACDGKVWRIDTGMNPTAYKGPIEVLEIQGSSVRPLRGRGREDVGSTVR
jgi:hypothetical protein